MNDQPHYHAWADGRRVVICAEHATPGRLALADNSDGHNPHNPPVAAKPCHYYTCYTLRCWVGEISDAAYDKTGSIAYWTTPCTPGDPLLDLPF